MDESFEERQDRGGFAIGIGAAASFSVECHRECRLNDIFGGAALELIV